MALYNFAKKSLKLIFIRSCFRFFRLSAHLFFFSDEHKDVTEGEKRWGLKEEKRKERGQKADKYMNGVKEEMCTLGVTLFAHTAGEQ